MKSEEDVVKDFNEIVNMTADELDAFLHTEASETTGFKKDDGSGESVGHESGRKIVDILKRNPDKDPSKYTDEDKEHMRKVVAYAKRHLAQEGHLKETKTAEELEKTKSTRSLKNWGHDPLKTGDVKKSDKPASKKAEKPASKKAEKPKSKKADKAEKVDEADETEAPAETAKPEDAPTADEAKADKEAEKPKSKGKAAPKSKNGKKADEPEKNGEDDKEKEKDADAGEKREAEEPSKADKPASKKAKTAKPVTEGTRKPPSRGAKKA